MSDAEIIEISDEMVKTLRAQKERTGIGARALLKGRRHDMPEKLSAAIIDQALRGTRISIRRDHYDYALMKWEELPDRGDAILELTPEIRDALKAEKNRTGITEARLLKGVNGAPGGLKGNTVTAWMYNPKLQTLRKDQYEFVMALWAELPDKKVLKHWREIVAEEHQVSE